MSDKIRMTRDLLPSTGRAGGVSHADRLGELAKYSNVVDTSLKQGGETPQRGASGKESRFIN